MLGAGGGEPPASQPSGVTQRSARDGEAIGPCRAERPTGVDRERLRAGARRGIGILAVAPLEQLPWCPPRLDVPHDQADDAQKQQDLPCAPALFQPLAFAFTSAIRVFTKRRTSAAGGFFVSGKRIVPLPEIS